MAEYTCSGCSEPIPVSKARIECWVCRSPIYYSCANCFVVSRVTGRHSVEHRTRLFKSSGLMTAPGSRSREAPSPPTTTGDVMTASPPTGVLPPPPHQATTGSAGQGHQRPPPPIPPPPQRSESSSMFPPLPVHPGARDQYAAPSHPPPPSSNWDFLFNQNATPTPLCVTLLQEIFDHLDPSRSGLIPPEAYASFLNAQGCKAQDNIWANAYNNAYGDREFIADAALRAAYDGFSIEYVLQPRRQANPSVNKLSSSFANLLSSAPFPGPGSGSSDMPMLTLRGFIDLTTTEVLMDPSTGWGDLNRAIRYYQLPIWRAMGDIPRSRLPDAPNPIVAERVRMVTEQSAAMAQQAANIQAQGNLAAVNAIGGSQWEYRRY